MSDVKYEIFNLITGKFETLDVSPEEHIDMVAIHQQRVEEVLVTLHASTVLQSVSLRLPSSVRVLSHLGVSCHVKG